MEEMLTIMGERRSTENFEAFEDFEEYFIHCLNTQNAYGDDGRLNRKKLGLLMGYSQPAFSQRANRGGGKNRPRFNVNDVTAYMRITGDFRPVRYLEWQESKWKQARDQEMEKKFTEMMPRLERAYELLRPLFEKK